MRKFLIVLAVMAGLLAACSGNSVQPTEVAASPTEAPTRIPTSEPTLVPTVIPTKEPTPVPTEVPMYVGLPADEVEVLRQECLQENPGSLCLALPISPIGQDLKLEEISEVTFDADVPENIGSQTMVRLRVEDLSLDLPLPILSTVRSIGEGEVRVFGSGPGMEGGLWGVPVSLNRNLANLDTLLFQWGSFGGGYPEFMLVIRKADGSTFASDDLALMVGDRQKTALYQTMARIRGVNLTLRILRYESAGILLYGEPIFKSRVELGDLLRNGFGSIVYPLSPLTEVWSETEAYQYAKANCQPIEIGYGEAEIFGYADELLERAGILADPESPADRGVYPLGGCVVVYYAPLGGQSVIAFEGKNGEVTVIKTEPFEFFSIVGQ